MGRPGAEASSSGGKQRLGAITKRGDAYLRGLLTQGARSTLQVALKRAPEKRSRLEQWIVALHGRVGYHKTLVAIANKHVRIIWAILAHESTTTPTPGSGHAPAHLNPSTRRDAKIDNEVRPSTVKTWLTTWQASAQPIDHRLRALAVNRMRTPCATFILARMTSLAHPTRPCREMQSYPQPRSTHSRFHSARAPPQICVVLLTGNSVEVVMRLAHRRIDRRLFREYRSHATRRKPPGELVHHLSRTAMHHRRRFWQCRLPSGAKFATSETDPSRKAHPHMSSKVAVASDHRELG